MRRFFVIIPAAALLLSFVGCNADLPTSQGYIETERLGATVLGSEYLETELLPPESAVPAGLAGQPIVTTAIETTTAVTAELITEHTTVASETAPARGVFEASDLVLTCEGCELSVGMNVASVLSTLPEPQSSYSAPSCNYDGEDKTFIYDSFTIYTYPSGSADRLLELEINGVMLKTAKGIGIGSTLDSIIHSYGENYTIYGNVLAYSSNGKMLYFNLSGDIVTAFGIAYSL